ncbi:hypothetical protein CRENBAI_011291 [Crenichthys baileyi]|uniref:Uncharacterized protein n=1 Tax=Crenichthys baileyi TaxID=28760 RepID=A0AAV9RBH2_9TELE
MPTAHAPRSYVAFGEPPDWVEPQSWGELQDTLRFPTSGSVLPKGSGEGVVRDRNLSAAWRSNRTESRGAARWRVDKVRLVEAEGQSHEEDAQSSP